MMTTLQRLLSIPALYDLSQNLMGARKNRMHFVQNFIQPFSGMRILDIGCGTAKILDFLPHDIQYFGFDLSNRYILEAKKQYGDRATFQCQSVTTALLNNLGSFDVVLALGVLHHLTDSEAESLALLASSALKPGGRLLTFDGCYIPEQNPIARFLLSIDRGRFVREPRGYTSILEKAFAEVNYQVIHRKPIPYTHFITFSKNVVVDKTLL